MLLDGLPVETPLDWWAAAGVLAAATDLDEHATLAFTPSPTGTTPILTSRASLDQITEQVTTIRDHVAALAGEQPALRAKTEKLPAEWVRHAVATLPQHPPTQRAVRAALLDDTQPAPHGVVQPRVPWRHGNSSLIAHVLTRSHPASTITAALADNQPDQHDTGSGFGLVPTPVHAPTITGIDHPIRSTLHPLVLAATCRLPATGGPRPAGTSADRRRVQPTPREPVSWHALIALTQTMPQLPNRPWHSRGTEYTSWTEQPAPGRTFGWVTA